MNEKESESLSSYHQYLPAILQQDIFIGRFLLAFEKTLNGLNDTSSEEQIITAKTQNPSGLSEIVENIHLYFKPDETPEEFLPWLAGWVALSLRDDWKVKVKRAFIQQIVLLYRKRGTKQGLIEILGLYLESSGFPKKVEVFDQFDNFPNYFQVQLTLPDRDPDKYWRQAKIAKAIIDREKPAQTFYTLKILVPTMQLTKRSHVAYPLKLFEAPEIQELQPHLIAIIEKIELEAIVEITRTSAITTDLLNKITVRFKDDISDYYLLTPETDINNNQIRIKRTLNYEQFLQSTDKLTVTIQNLNNIDISGKVTVKAFLNINQPLSTFTLLQQNFNLAPVPIGDILRICRQDERGEVIKEENNTTLGTTSQSLS
jgi:phage tail-like protein